MIKLITNKKYTKGSRKKQLEIKIMWTKEENKWHIGIKRWNQKQIKTLQKNQEQKYNNQNNRGQIQ
jgi:hypothetical protein